MIVSQENHTFKKFFMKMWVFRFLKALQIQCFAIFEKYFFVDINKGSV